MLVFPYVFTSTTWEMALTTSHPSIILKIQKSREVLTYYWNSSFLNAISWHGPLKDDIQLLFCLSFILLWCTLSHERENHEPRGGSIEYWMIYRGPGCLSVVWFGSSLTPSPPLPWASCLSFSVFLCTAVGRAYWRERVEGVGEEPTHATGRKPGPL